MSLYDDYLLITAWQLQNPDVHTPVLGVTEIAAKDRLLAASLPEMIAAGIPSPWAEAYAGHGQRTHDTEEADLKT